MISGVPDQKVYHEGWTLGSIVWPNVTDSNSELCGEKRSIPAAKICRGHKSACGWPEHIAPEELINDRGRLVTVQYIRLL